MNSLLNLAYNVTHLDIKPIRSICAVVKRLRAGTLALLEGPKLADRLIRATSDLQWSIWSNLARLLKISVVKVAGTGISASQRCIEIEVATVSTLAKCGLV